MALNQGRRSSLPKLNKSTGKLSRKAKARMNNAINWMIYLSQGQTYYSKRTKQKHKLHINFITLTLSAAQFTDDKTVVNKMLKPFLRWMKQKGNNLYVWRAETQHNGNIHFHITSNKFLHYESIRNKWNDIQRKTGYMKKYIESGGNENPNSTDVEGVKDKDLLAGYMVKYMGKAAKENYCVRYCSLDQRPAMKFVIGIPEIAKDGTYCSVRRDVECKVWNCSTDLMKIKITMTEMDKGYEILSNEIETRCQSKQLEGFRLFLYPSDNFRNGALEWTDQQLARNEIDLN